MGATAPVVKRRLHPRTAIIFAALTYFFVNSFVPFGERLLYPLDLFTTWVHEMGHGLTALALGGRFEKLVMDENLGGAAYAFADDAWKNGLICAGGLLAPPLLGAFIIAFVHGSKRARGVLGFLTVALAFSIAVYVRTTVGVVWMSVVAVFLGWSTFVGFRENPHRRVILVQLLGVMLTMDTLTRMIGYALSSEANKGEKSDAQLMADYLGGTYWLWGLAVIAVALLLLGGSLWWAWRRPELRLASAAGAQRGKSLR
jgi:hypothetical protein